MTTQDSIFLPASRFADKGDWTLEQQFILQMGSSYLLAHGIGTPLAADAETTCTVPEEGDYTLLVRTKNWIRPWSDGPAPGIFQVKIDGTADGETFGTGADDRWYWQKGGKHHLTAGEHRIALHDLTGFDGRCDALILTRTDEVPGASLEAYRAVREALLGEEPVEDLGPFDFVVVGGGIAGECAAIAAARLGAKVALLQDRYVLGGNNSSEVRVGLGGMINLPPYGALGYILNEKLRYYELYHAACFTLTREEMAVFHFRKGDAEGLVNIPQQIKGLRLSISLREDTDKENLIWVSLRSVDDFPANQVAEQFFNGGGHLNAAGGRIYGTMDDAIDAINKALKAFATQLQA